MACQLIKMWIFIRHTFFENTVASQNEQHVTLTTKSGDYTYNVAIDFYFVYIVCTYRVFYDKIDL